MKVLIASDNTGKIKEINHFFENLDIEIVPQSIFKILAVEETALSFVENALLKARHGAKHSQLPCIADDSGLCVDALGGAPGIYSARYAKENAHSAENIEKLLKAMVTIEPQNRQAHYYCAMVFVRHELDPAPLICQAQWDGEILSQTQGLNGFGYDPVFFIPELNCSAAELTLTQKNKISHRAKALKALTQALKQLYFS